MNIVKLSESEKQELMKFYSKIKPSDPRINQKYGTFEERLRELSKKTNRTETVDSEYYGKITIYYDKDGIKIGSSGAPIKKKELWGM